MLALRIQLKSIPGGWRLSVGRADSRPAQTDLSEGSVATAAERIGMLLAPAAVLATDARRSRSEESAGTELAGLFQSSEVNAALHGLLGEARGRSELALILVDAPEPIPRALPWELLGDGSPLEARGEAVLARLVGGRAANPTDPASSFTVVLGSPDPDDSLCRSRLQALQASLAARKIPCVEMSKASDISGPQVLHIVAHGAVDDAEAQVLRPDGTLSAGTAAHSLTPWLSAVQLVVLDVCDAGNTSTPESYIPGARLVEAGAPAVVAPATRLGVEAAEAFADGLYQGLSAGRCIAESVSDGRRAVRNLGRAHPDSRWMNPVLHLSGDAAALQRLQNTHWRPAGWAPQHPEVTALLHRARELASPHGFVGIEHLLAAWPTEGGGSWSAHLRYTLAHRPDPFLRLGSLRPRTGHPGAFDGTPRLRALQPESVDLEGLARLLWNQPEELLQAWLNLPAGSDPEAISSHTTLMPIEAATALAPEASALEVLGGPEDGRRFGPGDTIGRASPDRDGLYRDSPLVDPYLSRRALIWGERGPELLKPATRSSPQGWIAVEPGPIRLRVGDQLCLTPGTLLRVL